MRRILIILLCGLFSIKSALALDPFVISDIRVEGLQRISEGTVFNYLPLDANELLTASRGRQAIRSLFRQGFSVLLILSVREISWSSTVSNDRLLQRFHYPVTRRSRTRICIRFSAISVLPKVRYSSRSHWIASSRNWSGSISARDVMPFQ